MRVTAVLLLGMAACGDPVDPSMSTGGGGAAGGVAGGASAGGGLAGGSAAGGSAAGGSAGGGSAAGGSAAGGSAAGGSADAGVLLPDGGCNAAAFVRLGWPFPGTNGLEWVVSNYVDLDGTGGLRDWMGRTGAAAKTYDGHRGIDIDVPSFRAMDADFPVIAAAAGVVTQVVDGFADRNIGCTSNNANVVRIRQDDCSTAIYAHFKRNSIRVAVGQRVAEGQQLGVVGSSGCSTQAHLHYEITNAANVLEEPFATNRWRAPPPYTTAASVMDVTFRSGAYTDVNEVKDPGVDPPSLPPGTIGIASNTANGRPGDVLSMRLLQPDGGVGATGTTTLNAEFRHSFWWWNRSLPGVPGQWTIEVRANGGAPTVRRFQVP